MKNTTDHDGFDTNRDAGAEVTGETQLTAAAALDLIETQQRTIKRKLEISGSFIIGLWGVSWLIGYCAIWATQGGIESLSDYRTIGFVIYAGVLALAFAVTMIYVLLRSRGTRGDAAWTGAVYGMTWFAAFLVFGALSARLVPAIQDGALIGLMQSSIACLIVGIMYMVGGALWKDKPQSILGAWILVTTAAGLFVGAPAAYLVQALAGGGGMILSAFIARSWEKAAKGRE